mgnify:CR=1 FL=1
MDYRLLGQSYEPDGDAIDEKRKYDGMGELAKKLNLDPLKPGDYMRLKQLMRKDSKLNPPVDGV